MAKSTLLIILICFITYLPHCFSSVTDEKTAVDESKPIAGGKEEDWWFHWGFPHPWPHPPLVHPPLPANFPKIHWPKVHPPIPSGGFKWPPRHHWPFVHPPIPSHGFKWPPKWPHVHPPIPSHWPRWPKWPYVHPPIPAGGFKWPPHHHWPPHHWPFVHPPMPAGGKWPPHWPFVHPPFPCPWWPHKGFDKVESGKKGVTASAAPPAQ